MPDRRELLVDLLERRRATSVVREELGGFGWDSDELVVLERRHIESALNAFISGEISASDVEEWADVIEARDDIGYPDEDRDLLLKAIFELATPELIDRPLETLVHDWLRKLRSGHGFEDAYSGVESSDGPSSELRPLLRELYDSLTPTQPDLGRVKGALIKVLTFLTTPQGRTDANCTAVDHFLMLDDNWERPWGDRLPDDFQNVLADMAGGLHDTVSAPEVAENFDSTPEQLLHRAEKLKV